MRLVLRESLALACLGLAAGALASYALANAIERLLFGVEAHDPSTYAAALATLLAVALAASGIPAWRAAKVPPTEALRGR